MGGLSVLHIGRLGVLVWRFRSGGSSHIGGFWRVFQSVIDFLGGVSMAGLSGSGSVVVCPLEK